MKKKQPPLLSERIKQAVAARKPSAKTWFDRLDESVKQDLISLKQSWKSGEFASSTNALARDIIQQCAAGGIETCGMQGMRTWLSRD
jgi:hypothetical protein